MSAAILSLLLVAGSPAPAAGAPVPGQLPVEQLAWAAEIHGLDPVLLAAVAYQESRWHPWALNIAGRGYFPGSREEALELVREHEGQLARGRMDFGWFQINSRWLARVSEAQGVEITPESVLDPWTNAAGGASILAYEIGRADGDVWKGVGLYHSKSPARAEAYADKVRGHYDWLLGLLGEGAP